MGFLRVLTERRTSKRNGSDAEQYIEQKQKDTDIQSIESRTHQCIQVQYTIKLGLLPIVNFVTDRLNENEEEASGQRKCKARD